MQSVRDDFMTSWDGHETLEAYAPFTEANETAYEQAEDAMESEDLEEEEEAEDQESQPVLFESELVVDTAAAYSALGLQTRGLSFGCFETAVTGYRSICSTGQLQNDRLLTIVDFTQSSARKRMYVLDLVSKNVLIQCKVAHGRNSEDPANNGFARFFSNEVGKNKSSIGFYITGNTYQGKNGLSLQLNGIDGEFNSNALRRRVVIHGARYVHENDTNVSGRSWGCPAVDLALVSRVIDTIKGGTCYFIYFNDPVYLEKSKWLTAAQRNPPGADAARKLVRPMQTLGSKGSGPGIDTRVVSNIARYRDLIERISREGGLNPNIVRGIIAAESGGDPNVGGGGSGYKGLMQAGREKEQLLPENSIRRGVKKFNQFSRYIQQGLKKTGLSVNAGNDEDQAQMVLACYNAGHVTVIKAIQYAAAEGDWRKWKDPRYYQRALLFSGGYDFYSSCTKGAGALQVAFAKGQKLAYSFLSKPEIAWWKFQDPPPWDTVSAQLSPILRCWIETKMKNTPGYLAHFLAYYRYFSTGVQQEAETFRNEELVQDTVSEAEPEEEKFDAYYGPEYFDSPETGNEQFVFEEEGQQPEAFEEEEDNEWEEENYYQDSFSWEPVATAAVTGGVQAVTPQLMNEDTAVPARTIYVNIDIGKANYPLTRTGIYVPTSFDPSTPVTLILYLHGMTGTFPGATAQVDQYWSKLKLPDYDFRLREVVNAAGRNVVFVMPSLGNSPNAYRNDLSTRAGGFDDYIDRVVAAINGYIISRYYPGQNLDIGSIVLSAHSAGGSQMRNIATLANPMYGPRIRQCWGFDCLYGGVSVWVGWAKKNPDKKLIIFFKNSTAGNANALAAYEKKLPNISVKESGARGHYLVPKQHLGQLVAALP